MKNMCVVLAVLAGVAFSSGCDGEKMPEGEHKERLEVSLPEQNQAPEATNTRREQLPSTTQSASQCVFADGLYYVDVYFGEKAGFEEGWNDYNGVETLGAFGFVPMQCHQNGLESKRITGKAFGPYADAAQAKKASDSLSQIMIDANWLHFYLDECRFENGRCIDVVR